ncbi:lipopolysaccharide export system protein LptC [Noviherbaspirillum humi]|uniref:Lipopolysaccharide export system protein LptC n=1 Tax=Noviherbaspirillum humi TaxID=1688639 RepID=A0A239JF14_9BURK|nr:LPS export ABC transporter periplasmic protein LptC [Noviherbaspirillum humi]SNT04410.1 lipopolysaccharide export system protein LptC [Noviherbaspirillum humi]
MRFRPRRLRALLIFPPLLALALGSFWLLEVTRRAGEETPGVQNRTEPDFYVEKFSYVRISNKTATRYHVAGERLTHQPQDDSYEVEQPVLSGLNDPQTPPFMINAEHARLENQGEKVHLYRNVQMDRPASGQSDHLHLTSDYMLVLPDEYIMRTDKPVDITTSQAHLAGIGMYANHATGEFRLAGKVHGTYQAARR